MTSRQLPLNFEKTSMPIEIAFWQFHNGNPHIYTRLVEMARQLKAKGFRRYSINSLFEVLRWHSALKTKGSLFKLNNNYRSYYARLIMEKEPDIEGFFSIRKYSQQVME
jgi:hypothetical protein